MSIVAPPEGLHTTLCPACGYPSSGVCAACSQAFAVPVIGLQRSTRSAVTSAEPVA